jgi:hypothetical protein
MKHVSRHFLSSITVSAALLGLLSTAQCGGSTTSPSSTTTAVSAVTISPANVIAAGSVTGTVTLSAPAPAGGATVSLTSSNTGVATVPATASIAAGSSSIGFIVVAVAPGSAAITASMGTSSMQSQALTVTARATLVSVTLTTGTVLGGDTINGTVTLSGPAPAGGASVSLAGNGPLTVVSSVMVLTGATTATFSVATSVVTSTVGSTITASYGGDTKSAPLSVTAPTVATASFGITGPTESDTCTMKDGGAAINCTFNGSTSTAPNPIVAWDWTYTVGTQTLRQTTSSAIFAAPAASCSFLPAAPLPAPPAVQSLPLTVTLSVRDSAGNVSAVTTVRNARLLPQGVCGF